MIKKLSIIVFVAVLGLGFGTLSVFAGAIVVEDGWARASIGVMRPGVAFVTIVNRGADDDVLTGVETPVAGKARVHLSKVSNGVASMSMAGPVKVPAGGKVKLAPGGLHIMLTKLKQPLVKGKSFSMTLLFEKAGRIEVSVPVLSFGSGGPK